MTSSNFDACTTGSKTQAMLSRLLCSWSLGWLL